MSSNISGSLVPKEYDTTEREAHFFLYSTSKNNIYFKHSDALEIQHWALVAIFEDGSVRTLEGINRDGKLVPVFLKERPPYEDGSKTFRLASIRTSPWKLREISKTNALNGTDYQAIKNNCQNWVKATAKAISLDLAKTVENHKTTREIDVFIKGTKILRAISISSSTTVISGIKNLSEGHWSSESSEHDATT